MTNDISHEFQFPRTGTKVHRIALIDGPNMSNLGHRSKKVYGPNQGTIESLHAYVVSYGKSLGVDVETFVLQLRRRHLGVRPPVGRTG